MFQCNFSFSQQKSFSLSDSIVEVGQVYRFEFRFPFDGCYGDRKECDYQFNRVIIDSVIDFLSTHPYLRYEISNHTDSRGSDSANLRLSQKRANYIMEIFYMKLTDSVQIIAKGYGESQLIHSEQEINQYKSTDKVKFERLHQENRRTELKIVGIKE